MSLSKNQIILFGLLITLLIVKFVWIPWVDWQSSALQEISMKEMQLIKIKDLLDKKDLIDSQSNSLNDELNEVKDYFYADSSQSNFRLSIQDKLQKLAESKDITISQFSWLDAGGGEQIVRETIELRLKGDVVDLVNFQIAIESEKRMHQITYFNFTFPRAKAGIPSKFSGVLRIQYVADLSGT